MVGTRCCVSRTSGSLSLPEKFEDSERSMNRIYCSLLIALTCGIGSNLSAQVETFDLPRLEHVKIDGDFSDWDQKGFGVEVLLQEEGSLKNASDHNVHFRAGWNRDGMLILVTVQDDNWVEYPEKGKYYSADVVEVFLAGRRGDEDVCQWYVTPGMTEAVPKPGVRFRELRRGPTKGMGSQMKVAREKLAPNKYRMEIFVPWSGIGKEGKAGTKAAFQIWVNDKDRGSTRRRYMSIFYPAKGASYATRAMHNIRLVDKDEPSLRITALGEYDTAKFRPFVRLLGTEDRIGEEVTVKNGEEILGRAVLGASSPPGRSTAKIILPAAPRGNPYTRVGVYLGKQPVNTVTLPYSDVIGALEPIYRDRARYRAMFKLDEPWADLTDAPLLERHRGLAAAGLNLLEQNPLPNSEKEMEVLSKLLDMLRDLDSKEDYFAKQRNGLWGYYFCRADGTGQRFSMTIPRNYDAKRSYPLYVNLHGNGGRPLPTQSEAKQDDYFQIRPWGRGDISYFGLGEVDVLESMRHVIRWYSIDTNRICLGGHSMGGNGTWDLASKYPNLFACLVPKAGRSGDDYYENFRHLPALIQHGAKDHSQPVDFGRYTVDRLQQLGFPVIYKEFPEDGHGIRNPYPVETWFVEQHRPERPEIVTFTCDTSLTGQAYWLNIRRFIDPHRAASIDARVTGQSAKLKPTNIEILELDLTKLPSDQTKPLVLKIGNQRLTISAPQPDQTTLRLQNGEWRLVESRTPPATGKRPYQPGAVGNLYAGEPLLIVYPTEGPKSNRQLFEQAARGITLYGGYGGEMITGSVPIKADRDVSESDIENRNLVLFGGPKYNAITRRIASGLSVSLNKQNQFVVDGHEAVDADTSSLQLTQYNPLAPQRLIHVIWQDEIPEQQRARFARSARYRLPGASGRHPHNVPDLQITSPDLKSPIRRQFTYNWQLKPRSGQGIQPTAQSRKEGTPLAKLRIMREKAGVDYALSRGPGGWSTGAPVADLEQYRFRNHRMTTFKAKIQGKHLQKLFTDPALKYLISHPTIRGQKLDPEKTYSIAAPESILWSAKTIRTYWTDMIAGPDIEKSDLIRGIYGIDP